jgi:diguanylate cyclase (GGDEF)-like protein/PAS domain S-box-containing protein
MPISQAELLVALALLVAGTLSLRLTRTGGISLFWPGSAIAATVLIRLPRVRWVPTVILLWLVLCLVNLLVAHRSWPLSTGLAAVNLAEIALMTVAFRRIWRFPYPDIGIGHAAFMTAVLGVVIPGMTAVAGGALLHLGGVQPFAVGALQWWSSHTLGACLVGPPIILFSRERLARLCQSRFLLQNVGLLLLCVLSDYFAVRYVHFPFVLMNLVLLVSAFGAGGFGTALLSLASGLTIITLWAMGIRPLGLETTAIVNSLVGLPVVAVLATVMPPVTVGIGTDARRAVTRALRDSERHFREAIEHSPVGILIADLDGVWRHGNRALCQMLGYSAEELRTLPPGGPSSQDEWEASRGRWQRLLAGELDHYDVERRFQHRDGHWIWVHVAVSMMRDEAGTPLQLIAQIESLEARRAASQRLAEERQRLTTILQSIDDAVLTTDAEMRLTYVNAAAETLLGVTGSQAENRRVDELLHLTEPDSLKPAVNLLARSIASGRLAVRESGCLLHRPDGAIRYIRDSVCPVLGPDGLFAGTVIVLRDVSSDMDREMELQQRASHDALTGLVARGEFQQRLAEVFTKARLRERPAALVAIDLDRFKALNDTAGHAGGDAMLRKVAETCRGLTRASDTVARLGGDEFAILLDGCSADLAVIVGEQLLQVLNPLEIEYEGSTYSVGASIGVAALGPAMRSEQDWMEAADQACYRAKRAGRGQMQVA